MTSPRLRFAALFFVALALLAGPRPAAALFLGDVVPDTRKGEWEAGLALSGTLGASTLFASYGLSDTKALRGELGLGNLGSTEFGLVYRATVGGFKLGGKDSKWGLLGGLYAGGAAGASYTTLVASPGLSVPLNNQFTVYGGLALVVLSLSGAAATTNSLLFDAGTSFAVNRNFKFGGEIHFSTGSALVLWAKYKF